MMEGPAQSPGSIRAEGVRVEVKPMLKNKLCREAEAEGEEQKKQLWV